MASRLSIPLDSLGTRLTQGVDPDTIFLAIGALQATVITVVLAILIFVLQAASAYSTKRLAQRFVRTPASILPLLILWVLTLLNFGFALLPDQKASTAVALGIAYLGLLATPVVLWFVYRHAADAIDPLTQIAVEQRTALKRYRRLRPAQMPFATLDALVEAVESRDPTATNFLIPRGIIQVHVDQILDLTRQLARGQDFRAHSGLFALQYLYVQFGRDYLAFTPTTRLHAAHVTLGHPSLMAVDLRAILRLQHIALDHHDDAMLVELYESTLGILEKIMGSHEAALDTRQTDAMMRRVLPMFSRAADVLLRAEEWDYLVELLDRMRTTVFALATRCCIESTEHAASWIAGVAEEALESHQHGVYLAAGRLLSSTAVEFARRCPDHAPRLLDFALRHMRLMDERVQKLAHAGAAGAAQQFLQEWQAGILRGRYWDVFRIPEAMYQEVRSATYPSLADALDAMTVMSQQICGFARETITHSQGMNTHLRWGLANGLYRLASAWIDTGRLEQIRTRHLEVDRQLRMSLGLLHTMRVWPQPAGDAPDERPGEALLALLIDATKERYQECR